MKRGKCEYRNLISRELFSLSVGWYQGNDLLLGNVGDSRAVLGTVGEDGSLMAVQLTVDLKPDIPSKYEKEFSLFLAHYLFLPCESCRFFVFKDTYTYTCIYVLSHMPLFISIMTQPLG